MKHDSVITFFSGGTSRRMGTDKASLKIGGKQLLLHNVEDALNNELDIFIASANKRYDFLEGAPIRYIPDYLEGNQGPLSALAGALEIATIEGYSGTWVMATDQMLLPTNLLNLLSDIDNSQPTHILYATKKGNTQPLLAWYPIDILDEIKGKLLKGIRRIIWVTELKNSFKVEIPTHWHHRCNLNTRDDLKHYYEYEKLHSP